VTRLYYRVILLCCNKGPVLQIYNFFTFISCNTSVIPVGYERTNTAGHSPVQVHSVMGWHFVYFFLPAKHNSGSMYNLYFRLMRNQHDIKLNSSIDFYMCWLTAKMKGTKSGSLCKLPQSLKYSCLVFSLEWFLEIRHETERSKKI